MDSSMQQRADAFPGWPLELTGNRQAAVKRLGEIG
jgi:hypothetical protein